MPFCIPCTLFNLFAPVKWCVIDVTHQFLLSCHLAAKIIMLNPHSLDTTATPLLWSDMQLFAVLRTVYAATRPFTNFCRWVVVLVLLSFSYKGVVSLFSHALLLFSFGSNYHQPPHTATMTFNTCIPAISNLHVCTSPVHTLLVLLSAFPGTNHEWSPE